MFDMKPPQQQSSKLSCRFFSALRWIKLNAAKLECADLLPAFAHKPHTKLACETALRFFKTDDISVCCPGIDTVQAHLLIFL